MPTPADRRANVLLVIAGAGLLIGVFDLLDALIYYGTLGVAPIKIPQSIASGVLGRVAYRDGMVSAAFGVALHFFIAFCQCRVAGDQRIPDRVVEDMGHPAKIAIPGEGVNLRGGGEPLGTGG